MNTLALSLLAASACLVITSAAPAATIACDDFAAPTYTIGADAYPAGGTGPNSGFGWTTGWNGSSGFNITAPRTIAAALTYPGLATTGDAAASPAYVGAGTNSTAVRGFTAPTAAPLWVSFLIQLNDNAVMANANSAGNYGGIALIDAAGSHFLYMGIPGGATGYSLQTNAAIAPHGAAVPAAGKTDLLVMHIGIKQNAQLWVDPPLGQPLGTPDAIIALPLPASAYDHLYWSDSWGWTYSHLRIGTSLAAVTPGRPGHPACAK